MNIAQMAHNTNIGMPILNFRGMQPSLEFLTPTTAPIFYERIANRLNNAAEEAHPRYSCGAPNLVGRVASGLLRPRFVVLRRPEGLLSRRCRETTSEAADSPGDRCRGDRPTDESLRSGKVVLPPTPAYALGVLIFLDKADHSYPAWPFPKPAKGK
jgi:hypothetical protein